MASITREPNGRRTIQFVGSDGKRRSIRLGKVSQRLAESVQVLVEHLAAAQLTGGALDGETARRVAELDMRLADKLAAVGLIPKRQRATLGPFLDSYIGSRADVKGSTATVYGHTRRCLVAHFGAERPLHEITAGDADAWRLWLLDHEKLADNTVRRRCGIAKQFFKAAVRRKLIAENPFVDLVAAVRRNDKRYYFVTLADAQKVLEACPDAQWRLLFALSRFGGLRCPSEHLGLRWGDVDWARSRITVHSPKTEHHPGGASRQIPIFPELRPYLEEVWEQAEPGTEWVITRYRDSNVNLRSQLLDIIQRAGLKEWPKLFQNLRSTRQTELAETYPMHVVCAWIGNSAAVAAKHYLQVTDEHFNQAVQNPVQQPHESPCNGRQENTTTPGFSEDFQGLLECTRVQVGGTGLEPATSTV
jgi:integrase